MRRLTSILLGVAALFFSGPSANASTIYGTAFIQADGTGPSTLYTINPNDGAATPIGLIGYDLVGAIDFKPNTNILYGIGTSPSDSGGFDLITINLTTGVGTTVGSTGLFSNFQDISFRSDGTLFGISNAQVYTINLGTGLATALPNPTGLVPGNDGSGLAFNLSDVLFNINGDIISTINQTSGMGTPTGNTVDYPISLGNAAPNAMDYDPSSGILYASVLHEPLGNFIAEIDVTTSTNNVDNPRATVSGLNGLAVLPDQVVNGVPENMSTLWLALPLCGLFVFARARRA